MEFLGIRFVGLSPENGRKLLITLAFLSVFLILRYGLTALARLIMGGRRNEQTRFWIQQSVSLALALLSEILDAFEAENIENRLFEHRDSFRSAAQAARRTKREGLRFSVPLKNY